jgi:hypothetical protein
MNADANEMRLNLSQFRVATYRQLLNIVHAWAALNPSATAQLCDETGATAGGCTIQSTVFGNLTYDSRAELEDLYNYEKRPDWRKFDRTVFGISEYALEVSAR